MKKRRKRFLRFQLRRARRSAKARRRFASIVLSRRKRFIGVSKELRNEILKNEKTKRILDKQFRTYEHVIAPAVLSMIDNTEETITFIKTLEKHLEEKQKVFIHLRNVNKIAHGAIVVLLSIMMKFKANDIKFNGDKPKSLDAFNMLESSGFFKHLYRKYDSSVDLSIEGDRIFTHSKKIVDQEQSDQIIHNVSNLVWGEPRRCTKLQRVFIELMQNTNNHAALSEKGYHHWWTTACYIPEEQKACFAFIDYGVGILASLESGKRGIFTNLFNEIVNFFKPTNNAKLIELLLKGDLHELARKKKPATSTRDYFRGKGLPGIYKAFKTNQISNLVVISNNVIAKCAKDSFEMLNSDLSGTFVYWELNSQNNSLPLYE